MTRLSDVAAVESGSGFPIADQGVADAEFPFLKVSDMNSTGNETEIRSWNHTVSEVVRQRLRARAFPAGTVIFPKIGAAIATNKKRLLTRPSCIDNNCMGVIADAGKLDPYYLYYLFRAKNLSDFASDSNPPSIRKTEVESWDIAVPPLNDQRRIVEQLLRAENIVRMRREAEQKAKEIIPALFLDMFGDPATNPKGWPMKCLGEVASYTRYGPRFPDRKYAEAGARILRTTDMDVGGNVRWNEAPIMPVTADEADRFSLAKGTLVITRTGATIGKVALFRGANDPCIAGAYLIEIGLVQDVNPEYALALLLGEYGQKRLTTGSRAVAQPNLNAPTIRAIPIPVPPRAAQDVFSEKARAVRQIQVTSIEATSQAQLAFQSLLAEVFGE